MTDSPHLADSEVEVDRLCESQLRMILMQQNIIQQVAAVHEAKARIKLMQEPKTWLRQFNVPFLSQHRSAPQTGM